MDGSDAATKRRSDEGKYGTQDSALKFHEPRRDTNGTKAAEESNAENLLIIRDDPKLYAAYAENFGEHLAHAEGYEGMGR